MALMTLPLLYAERARLSYLIEHGTTHDRDTHLPFYQAFQDDLLAKARAYAAAYVHLGRKPPPLAPPWCSICGRNDRELLPGQIYCIVCAGILPQQEGVDETQYAE